MGSTNNQLGNHRTIWIYVVLYFRQVGTSQSHYKYNIHLQELDGTQAGIERITPTSKGPDNQPLPQICHANIDLLKYTSGWPFSKLTCLMSKRLIFIHQAKDNGGTEVLESPSWLSLIINEPLIVKICNLSYLRQNSSQCKNKGRQQNGNLNSIRALSREVIRLYQIHKTRRLFRIIDGFRR